MDDFKRSSLRAQSDAALGASQESQSLSAEGSAEYRENQRNRRLQSMEQSLEARRKLTTTIDIVQAAPVSTVLPSDAIHHSRALPVTGNQQPLRELHSFSSKDGSSSDPHIATNEDLSGPAPSLLPPPVPAVARREDILVQELQTFDAALLKTFPSISPSAVNAIIQNATRRLGAPGCEIFREGDSSLDMIFLVSGCLDVRKRGQSIGTIDCSSIVGHHAYMYQRPRSATIVVSSGRQCVYYTFSIDKVSDDMVAKPGLWHSSTARVISSKSSNQAQSSDATAPHSDPNLITADADAEHLSPVSKKRMSALLGEGFSARRYTRDALDYEDSPETIQHEVSDQNGLFSSEQSSDIANVEHGLQSPPASRMETIQHEVSDQNGLFSSEQSSDIANVEHGRQSPPASRTQTEVVARESLRQRPESASAIHSDRHIVPSASLARPASSRARPSVAAPSVKPTVYFLDVSEHVSPRQAADVASHALRSGPAKLPNRKPSIIARTKEAVQQQLSLNSSGAVTCIIYSAAWLLCLTHLEKLRMPEPRQAVCR